jgi:hypothetical protein
MKAFKVEVFSEVGQTKALVGILCCMGDLYNWDIYLKSHSENTIITDHLVGSGGDISSIEHIREALVREIDDLKDLLD